jgi:hypothetical protein
MVGMSLIGGLETIFAQDQRLSMDYIFIILLVKALIGRKTLEAELDSPSQPSVLDVINRSHE